MTHSLIEEKNVFATHPRYLMSTEPVYVLKNDTKVKTETNLISSSTEPVNQKFYPNLWHKLAALYAKSLLKKSNLDHKLDSSTCMQTWLRYLFIMGFQKKMVKITTCSLNLKFYPHLFIMAQIGQIKYKELFEK